jgi:hypothetical protein
MPGASLKMKNQPLETGPHALDQGRRPQKDSGRGFGCLSSLEFKGSPEPGGFACSGMSWKYRGKEQSGFMCTESQHEGPI